MINGIGVQDATHVKIGGKWEKIASKWGVGPKGQLAKPSEGGFGVITEDGRRIDMWTAESYGKPDPPGPLTEDDKTLLTKMMDANGKELVGLLYDYYRDADRADRTPRSYLYLHMGMLLGLVMANKRRAHPQVSLGGS